MERKCDYGLFMLFLPPFLAPRFTHRRRQGKEARPEQSRKRTGKGNGTSFLFQVKVQHAVVHIIILMIFIFISTFIPSGLITRCGNHTGQKTPVPTGLEYKGRMRSSMFLSNEARVKAHVCKVPLTGYKGPLFIMIL